MNNIISEKDFLKDREALSEAAAIAEKASLAVRKERMKQVDLDKDFDTLLDNPAVLDVFVRLRDK